MSDPNAQPKDPTADAEKAAREYAWQWFQYHAGQRQTVFRFFLIVAGAAFGGYLTAARVQGLQDWAYWFGAIMVVLAVLFGRLDIRSHDLVRCAEMYLRREESRLADILGTQDIRISQRAHDARVDAKGLAKWIYSFRQVYRVLFWGVGMAGMAILLFDPKSPVTAVICRLWRT